MSSIILSGDCGGTNTRLSLWLGNTLTLVKKYENQHYPSFESIVDCFLNSASTSTSTSSSTSSVSDSVRNNISICVLACAGPVLNNSVSFTNISSSGWEINGMALASQFGIKNVQLINDFTAMGYGLLTLKSKEIHVLNDVPKDALAPIATIGAGTGLGECFLTPTGTNSTYQCFPTEGGHCDFAPSDAIEVELLVFLKEKFQETNRISNERVISGIGLSNVYEFLVNKFPDQKNEKIHQEWKKAGAMQGAVIGKYASKHPSSGNTLCTQAMKIFVKAYGREAGNAALKYLPRGGFYITGGLMPKNLDFFTKSDDFSTAFFDKGRVSCALRAVPLYLVLTEDLGERGAHYYALQLSKPDTLTMEAKKSKSSTACSITWINKLCPVATLCPASVCSELTVAVGFHLALISIVALTTMLVTKKN